MREFSLVHEMDATVDGYWRAFFDPAYETAVVAALKFREYDVIERDETETMIHQKTRALPRLDVAAALAKLMGSSFGYLEEVKFDKVAKIMRVHTVPDALRGRMSFDTVIRVEPGQTETTCRRTIEFRIEARMRIGAGLFESGLEKNLRSGWAESTAFLNDWLRKASTRT